MADIHDFLASSRETDHALTMLNHAMARVNSTKADRGEMADLTLVAGLGFVAVAAAIREVGTRQDYVASKAAERARGG